MLSIMLKNDYNFNIDIKYIITERINGYTIILQLHCEKSPTSYS